MKKYSLSKFYKKSYIEKIKSLKNTGIISPNDCFMLKNEQSFLSHTTANHMIENYLLNYELPFGLAMNFVIDGKEKVIPMVTEEPSVIAAASNAGKITKASGGFTSEMENRLVIGQIVFKDIKNSKIAAKKIMNNENELLELANQAYPSILKYSEGAQKVEVRIINENKIYNSPEFFVIHLIVDTGEAMGANIVNTMAEAVSNKVLEQIEGANLMNILSNYATESIAKANCYIHPKDLANKQITGEGVRDRIIEASQLAKVDPYRAVTHNKGIMNGVDALLVASGNDWRAVEASVHAYASKDGQYRALSQWSKTEQGYLKGELELPISLGTVGGTLSVHPTAQLAHRIMNQPSANELSRILVAVGLGQNLAALKALVTDGIQKGHMALQAQSLAITVGAKGKEIDQLTKKLENSKHMNSNTAQKLLDSIRKEG